MSIDEKVVTAKFNNAQFEAGVKSTVSMLDRLKKALKLDGGTKGLDDIDAKTKSLSFQGIQDGVQNISSKFSALGLVAVGALLSIGSQALASGQALVKSFTIQPIMDGFAEYELKMGSIQTILANTSRYGTTLGEVTDALDDLNTYADKTIYNFGDMTKNIGLFTNAGIRIEDATSMIKGFSNSAAASGTNAQGAASAAYQLSQALSAGKITLMDWRSLQNVGMGNKNMQNGILEIADAMGTLEDKQTSSTEVAKDFNGSLEKGWLTADVMSTYLKIMAGDMDAAQMATLGLSEAQIAEFGKQQKIAEEAATKVRTFTQLMGTLKEAVGSSWAATFDLLFGNFDQATELFTDISEALGGIIGAGGEARNKLIQQFVDLGGRTTIIDGIWHAFQNVSAIIEQIAGAFRDVFPPVTAQQLLGFAKGFERLMAELTPSEATLEKIRFSFMGLFAAIDIVWMVIKGVIGVIWDLIAPLGAGAGGILDFTATLGGWIGALRDAIKNGEGLSAFLGGLKAVLSVPINLIKVLAGAIGSLFSGLAGLKIDQFFEGFDGLEQRFNPLVALGGLIKGVWEGVKAAFGGLLEFISPLTDKIGELFRTLTDSMAGGFQNFDFSLFLDAVNTGLLGGLLLIFKNFTKKLNFDDFFGGLFGRNVAEEEKKAGLFDTIKESLGGLTDSLSAMQNTLNAATLGLIAAAVGILTASIFTLSTIDPGKLTAALTAIGIMFGQLLIASNIMSGIAAKGGFLKVPFIAGMLILLSTAVLILSAAVKNLSGLDWNELARGLTGTAVAVGILVGAASLLAKGAPKGIVGAASLVILAVAIKILASAVRDFAGLDWNELATGMVGVAASMGILVGAMSAISKWAPKGIVGAGAMVIMAAAIKIMASAIKDFVGLDWNELATGITGAATAMGILVGAAVLLSKFGGSAILGAASMLVMAGAMKVLASAVGDFSGMGWEGLIPGLTGMGIAMGLIVGALAIIPPSAIVSAAAVVVISSAMVILAGAMGTFSEMSWDEIGRSMVVLAGSLVILTAAMLAMGNPVVLLGAVGITVAAAALTLLAPALVMLGGMSWDDIGRGLTILAAALALLAIGGVVILVGLPGLLGLGVAAVLLGTGLLLASVAVTAFAVAFTALGVALAVSGAGIVVFVTALIGLIPEAIKKVGEGIVEFANVIANSGAAFFGAMVTLLTSLIDAIVELTPQIIDALITLLFKLIDTLVANIPRLIQAGADLIVGILTGMTRNIGRIVGAATDLIVQFLNAIGNNIGRVTEAGADLIIKFIRSLTTTINNRAGELRDAGGKLALAIVDGMTGGLGSAIGRVAGKAAEMARSALSSAKSVLGIASPSKEFTKIGAWTAEGFANGIDKNADQAVKSAETMGKDSLKSIKAAMKDLVASAENDSDFGAMTIRPVLDLSSIKDDAGLISKMLQADALAVDKTYVKANAASQGYRSNQAAAVAAREEGRPAVPPTEFKFEQNITSPKAVSPTEVYRNTKSLISAAKGELDR